MDWVWIIAIWIGLAMATGAFFHAMVTARSWERIIIEEKKDEEQ